MGTIRRYRITCLAVYLILLIPVVNCYGANKNAEKFYEQGKKFSTAENADKAIENYSKAIKIDPKFVKAYNNRGIAYVWKKKYDLAIADFNTAIKLDPNNGKAYNNRAIVCSYMGDTDKARQDLEKAKSLGIQVDPQFLKKIEAIPPTQAPIFHKPNPSTSKAPAEKP
jgi:tetratricopeptide (TPR) repeat protein